MRAISILFAASIGCASGAQASELQAQAPATKGEAPVAPDAVRRDRAIVEIKKRFNAAADPITHRMTLMQARQNGWNGIAEHFSEIDQSGSGSVSFDDVAQYLRNRRHPAFAN
ncbi:hypothetical protein Bsp3421_005771 [Burkholderia sp. FERM BP-3421]|jgi:hypothetical protein|uniref:hypothetical protein n=1 Tax=Burkholderia sp. FERM BP-3421 TaxID=1494466 RepID=UPI0023617CDE|nr:hypothetical protein [Burkholderia sp. FERM BP-3421]WDD95595.1 hypothetical protein Bsp3421_005771 [Burkholderia sp. FERM BP-3421]